MRILDHKFYAMSYGGEIYQDKDMYDFFFACEDAESVQRSIKDGFWHSCW